MGSASGDQGGPVTGGPRRRYARRSFQSGTAPVKGEESYQRSAFLFGPGSESAWIQPYVRAAHDGIYSIDRLARGGGMGHQFTAVNRSDASVGGTGWETIGAHRRRNCTPGGAPSIRPFHLWIAAGAFASRTLFRDSRGGVLDGLLCRDRRG